MASNVKSSAGKKQKGGAKDDLLQQQDLLQAVIVAENFDNRFAPLTAERPSALFPLVNQCLLDYSLEALRKCGIQETFIFCSNHSQQIRSHIHERWTDKEGLTMAVTVISSESFMSLGDAIRELDSKALIRSDFILINGHVVTTLPLAKLLEEHKSRRKIDKGSAMTLVYRKVHPKHRTRCSEDNVLIAAQANSKKILFYQKIKNKKALNVPLEVFQQNDDVTIHYNVVDSHISICSPLVPPLYADNFDYQTFDDLVKGLIINEEVLGNSIYLHVANKGYCSSISNFSMYDAISQDIVQRWTYPVVPDLFGRNGSRYVQIRHNIYKDKNVDVHRDSVLQQNVVIGKNSVIGENVHIEDSIIGRNCRIGSNVTIKGSYLWDNVTIGDYCELNTSLLADNVVLKSNVKISSGCIMSYKVVIGDYVNLPRLTRLQSEPMEANDGFDDDEEEGDKSSIPDIIESTVACDPLYVGVDGKGYLFHDETDVDEDSEVHDVWGFVASEKSSSSIDEEEAESLKSDLSESDVASDHSDDVGSHEEEDATLFYSEVLDSLQRGIEEEIKSENLILEINSSKYAYNVTMKEVNYYVMKAILMIPYTKSLSPTEYFGKLKLVLKNLMPLLKNYIRNVASQLDCLQSIEEFVVNNEDMMPISMKIYHLLYDEEVLNENVIIKWHGSLSEKSSKLKIVVTPFVRWLKEADEESSDD